MTAPGSAAAAVRQRSPSSPAAPAPINTRDAQWTAAALQRKTSRARAHTPVQGEGKAGSRFIRVVAASSSSSSSSSSSKVTWKKKNPQATWQQSASQSDIPAVTSQHAHPQTGAGCSARAARTMEITSSPPSTASVACGIAILLGSRALAEAEAHARPRPVPLQLATSLPLARSLAALLAADRHLHHLQLVNDTSPHSGPLQRGDHRLPRPPRSPLRGAAAGAMERDPPPVTSMGRAFFFLRKPAGKLSSSASSLGSQNSLINAGNPSDRISSLGFLAG